MKAGVHWIAKHEVSAFNHYNDSWTNTFAWLEHAFTGNGSITMSFGYSNSCRPFSNGTWYHCPPRCIEQYYRKKK